MIGVYVIFSLIGKNSNVEIKKDMTKDNTYRKYSKLHNAIH